jgi:hypothetical protein
MVKSNLKSLDQQTFFTIIEDLKLSTKLKKKIRLLWYLFVKFLQFFIDVWIKPFIDLFVTFLCNL